MITVLHYIALLGSLMSSSLLLPALFGFGVGENEVASQLLLYAVLGGFVSLSILFSANGRVKDLDRITRIYLVVLGWIIVPMLMALPLSTSFNISYLDAIFETASAFTTTASDGIANIDSLPKTAIWLRAQIQWLGGLAVLTTFALFLGPLKIGGLEESEARSGSSFIVTSQSSVYYALWSITRIYLIVSVIFFSIFMLCGIQPFEASVLTSSAISTGGYLPNSSSLLDIAGNSGILMMSVFLLLSATSIYWHRLLLTGRWEEMREHIETKIMYFAVLVLFCIFFWVFLQTYKQSDLNLLFNIIAEAIFNSVSLATTSGIESRPGIFALISPLLIICILFVGASGYSTGGGIKYFRIISMLKYSNSEIKHLIYPNSVEHITQTIGRESDVNEPVIRMVWAMFCVALLVVAVGALYLSLTGMRFDAALHASIANFANAGPAYSPELVERGAKGWPAYADMNIGQKMGLSVIMIMGRLEIIAVLVAINPFYWQKR